VRAGAGGQGDAVAGEVSDDRDRNVVAGADRDRGGDHAEPRQAVERLGLPGALILDSCPPGRISRTALAYVSSTYTPPPGADASAPGSCPSDSAGPETVGSPANVEIVPGTAAPATPDSPPRTASHDTTHTAARAKPLEPINGVAG